MNLQRTLNATSEAVSITDVRTQLRITGTDDDDALRFFISAIREQTESYLGRTLITSTWEYKLDAFAQEIALPMAPVQSITSVAYVDDDGASQTLASSGYQFDRRGRLAPSYDNDWPDTRDQFDAVTITYVAGETHAGNVKEDIKLAMLLWIGACDINRENDVIGTVINPIPNGAQNILAPLRNWKL